MNKVVAHLRYIIGTHDRDSKAERILEQYSESNSHMMEGDENKDISPEILSNPGKYDEANPHISNRSGGWSIQRNKEQKAPKQN